MHLRIYLWLSCVILAGYVRATEVGISIEESGPDNALTATDDLQNDQHIPKEPYPDDDDDGSGVEPDESSGSGWGAGPGPDDEDGRGSGDTPRILAEIPEDDEDFAPRPTYSASTLSPVYAISEASPPVYIPPAPAPTTTTETQTAPPTTTTTTTEPPILRNKFDLDVFGAPKSFEEPKEGTAPGVETPARPEQTDISISGEDLQPSSPDQDQAGSNVNTDTRPLDNVVLIMNAKPEDRASSFFAQPGILAAVIGGAVVGLLCAILVVMFIVYRMRKKDEGSYALDEPKRSPAATSYGKGHNNREFYA